MSTVLVVDDSPIDRQLVIGLLKQGTDWTVTEASDGTVALESILQSPPDIVVTDLQMPGMTGLELLLAIRKKFSRIPVIVMTGETDSFLCHDLPVEAFLTKPLEYEQFCKIVVQLSEFWKADMMIPLNTSLVPKSEEER